MDVEGKHSRTLHLEDSDESLSLQDVADLAESALEINRAAGAVGAPGGEWSAERIGRAEHMISEIRGIE